MNRRKFLKISAVTAGAAIIGGGAFYTMFKGSDPLSPFFDATQKVFLARFGDDLSATLIMETKQAYEEKLKDAAAASQQRKYPEDFVSSFIAGDGKNFDYGLDITCKRHRA